jgi:hypothetical protein
MGVFQGIGTPTSYPTVPMPWGPQGFGLTQASFPYAQQQFLQPLQAPVQQALQLVPQQLQQIQQLVQLVPYQLQQIHQLIQMLVQQSSPWQQHGQLLQPFQLPPLGTQGWQTGQQQVFGGQGGYVM